MLKSGQNPEVAYTLFNDVEAAVQQHPRPQGVRVRGRTATSTTSSPTRACCELASGPFGPGTLGYVADTGLPTYDLDEGEELRRSSTRRRPKQPLAFTYQHGLRLRSRSAGRADHPEVRRRPPACTMTIKQVDEATLINYAIAGTFQASAWRNHPGFDPDTQWVWWHCDAAPADVDGARRTSAPTTPTHSTGNNCDNLVNFSKFNDAVINKAFETARYSQRPDGAQDGVRDHQQGVRQAGLGSAGATGACGRCRRRRTSRASLGPNLPTATSPDASADGAKPFTGLSSGNDLSGLWMQEVGARTVAGGLAREQRMRAVLRRLIQLVVVLLFVSFFSFALIALVPGDPVVAIVGFGGTPKQMAEIRHQLGLDQPFLRAVLDTGWSTSCTATSGTIYSGPTGRSAVSTAIRAGAAGVARADGLRDDPHGAHRDPARRARGVPVGHGHSTRRSPPGRSARSRCPTSPSRSS